MTTTPPGSNVTASTPARSGLWWRAHKWWLVALAIVLPLAVLSASFNAWVLHSATSFSDPQKAQAGHLEFRPRGLPDQGLVIDLDDVRTVQRAGGYRATPGVVDLWQITFTLSTLHSSSSDLASLCQIRIFDKAGREYAPDAGLTYRTEDDLSGSYRSASCSNVDDKPSWSLTRYFGMPAGVRPTRLEIGFNTPPSYAVFPLAT